MGRKKSSPSPGLVQEKSGNGFGVVNFAGEDQPLDLPPREPPGLNLLVLHRGGVTLLQASRQVDGHALLHITWTHEERTEFVPVARAIAGLLGQFAPGRL